MVLRLLCEDSVESTRTRDVPKTEETMGLAKQLIGGLLTTGVA